MTKLYYNQRTGQIDIKITGSGRFKEDSVSYESEDYQIATTGYFLNTAECLQKYHCNDLVELIITLCKNEIPISKVLYGGYIIVVYMKKTRKIQIFNDLLSKHSIYYSYEKESGQLFISDNFFEVVEMLKEKGLPYTIDELGVKMMLGHQIFYDDVTYVNEIKFLCPFKYITIVNNDFIIDDIQREEELDITMDEAAHSLHCLFKKAVMLQYEKNENNGYPQVTTVSGGMDSRSTFLYSLQCGYTSQKCYNYAETGSADFYIAEELTQKYNCGFYFHSLGKGNFLKDRDKLCVANEGQMSYAGTTGTMDCLTFFNTKEFAIIHTGLGGGEIMGDVCSSEHPNKREKLVNSLRYRLGKGKKDFGWSTFLTSLDCTEEECERIRTIQKKYRDFSEFQNLNDMRRCLNAQKIAFYCGCYYVSPFLYEDFFCYMLRIPYKLKRDRQLYLHWQKAYNPQQFETKSTFRLGVTSNNTMIYYAKRFGVYIINKFGGKSHYDMNPIEYWKKYDPTINSLQEELYSYDMRLIKNNTNEVLYKYINDRWAQNLTARENILTATWALTRLISD